MKKTSKRVFKKFRTAFFLAITILFSLTCSSVPENFDILPEFKLTILHTNDLHGRLTNMPQYSTIIKQVRNEGGNVLLLDGGDIYRRGTYERFNGTVETEIFNTMKYDAMVFGNADFPFNDKELYDISEHTILKLAKFPVLCGNVTINGNYIEGFKPYIIKNMNGIEVAIIGVTSLKPLHRAYDLTKRYLFEDPVQALNKLLVEVKEKSNIQIALSHAGFSADKTMRGISAVISADAHLKLRSPYIIKDGKRQIPIVQAGGERNNYLGRLDLIYIKLQGQWVLKEFKGRLFSLKDIPEDIEIQNISDKYN
ncbi:MAG: metallophosphoesterase [Treponema sp.]|jgi:2',3'-cyclic-nucleotide 2'-phosphodiesterase (5'-nucleotidase family)|nr:metallophosphoesterase [Treponema sp.]